MGGSVGIKSSLSIYENGRGGRIVQKGFFKGEGEGFLLITVERFEGWTHTHTHVCIGTCIYRKAGWLAGSFSLFCPQLSVPS